ncbi:hypothetical protein [Saliphagus sp. LR7]|uniref:DUF7319 domain-containing protein n=1 Tax=Saliphagus sp. LR7 TaxID=2282654 RepID=UPI0018E56B71|nr:hypothetical protein [Saliphagus sp. LR7]
MADPGDAPDRSGERAPPEDAPGEPSPGSGADGDAESVEALRERVEEKYDFEAFGPREMAEITPEEWDVAFDDESWITGTELLARVERELKSRIASREVFASLEYAEVEGDRALVAYSDTDYAIVFPDGSVEGRGTIVRDVKPTVALCSMDDYEVDDPPEDWRLPDPDSIPDSGSEVGNWMLQLLAATQLLVGLGTLVAWPILGARDNMVLLVVGLGFTAVGLVLFLMVANARLSEKFRLREYKGRLRSTGAASADRPDFLPIEDDAFEGSEPALSGEDEGSKPRDDGPVGR